MTKSDLIQKVYQRHGGLTKAEATHIVESMFDSVKSKLCHGEKVKIKNFGIFEVLAKRGRVGVNPITGSRIFINPKRSLVFRPAEQLKDQVNQGGNYA